ncbi:MAG: Spy/CpxP family protein refolding chaperone [Planctomycetota bacterium]
MKARWIALITVLCLVIPALAQERPERGRRDRPGRAGMERRGEGPRRGGPPGQMMERMTERLAQELELNEEQAAEFDEITTELREQMEARHAEAGDGRELREAMREARESGDEERVAQLRDQMRQSRFDPQPLVNEYFDQVATILNEEQLQTLNRFRERVDQMQQRGRQRGEMRQMLEQLPEQLELDEEQMAQFEEMREQLGGRGPGNRERWEEMRPLIEEMRAAQEEGNEARVAEIRQQLEGMRGERGNPMESFLTELEGILRDDQKAKLAELRAQFESRRGRDNQRPQDVRSILQAAKRLDLNEEQRRELNEIGQAAMRESRQLRRTDRDAQTELAERVKREIVEMLDGDQVPQFERMLQGERPRRGDRDGERGERSRRPRGERENRPGRDQPDESKLP